MDMKIVIKAKPQNIPLRVELSELCIEAGKYDEAKKGGNYLNSIFI